MRRVAHLERACRKKEKRRKGTWKSDQISHDLMQRFMLVTVSAIWEEKEGWIIKDIVPSANSYHPCVLVTTIAPTANQEQFRGSVSCSRTLQHAAGQPGFKPVTFHSPAPPTGHSLFVSSFCSLFTRCSFSLCMIMNNYRLSPPPNTLHQYFWCNLFF